MNLFLRPYVSPKTEKTAGVTAGALALACMLIAGFEGKENTPFIDKLGKGQPITGCYGSTIGIVWGRTYSDAECQQMLYRDARSHAEAILPYLPPRLPDKTAAAFYSFGYNVGSLTFAKSSVSRKALAGDLPGACRAIGLYQFSNGKDCRIKANRCGGIPKRRAAEVSMCLEGLR